jgi:hypothetical protein
MTRRLAIESVEGSIATRAGAGPAGGHHASRAIGNGPTRGLGLPLTTAASAPASSRPGLGPRAATDEDVLLRLALWLADVAAEAALVATTPAAAAWADEPPLVESAP